MKQRIKQLQSNQVYVPVKGDEVDQALADYINCNGKSLDIMFIRLQPGIYSFGSKKVCVKVDNNKINIRVGGGYMNIEEFLEKYTIVELEKGDQREQYELEKLGKQRPSSPLKGGR